jgi:hypothetical protein
MADAPLPQPASIALYGRTAPARIPFGHGAWSNDEPAQAVVVALEPSEDIAVLAAQLPDPASLAPRTLLVVLAGEPPRGLIGRLFARSATISRRARAAALLVRGYVEIAAGNDAARDLDLVWGYTPS